MENISATSRGHFHSRQQMENLLELQEQSGLSIKSFCAKHGISPATFYYWKKRLKAFSDPASGFAKLEVTAFPSAAALFAEVKGIRFYQPVSVDYLKALLS